MLELEIRRSLVDVLQPPPGYDLDIAIGTTFSLDLMSMLFVPLSFSLLGMNQNPKLRPPDPLLLLDALRKYSEKTIIFCQAGRIAVPRTAHLLYSYLEKSIFQVKSPNKDGVFHPKVWLLRFKNNNEPVLFRFACLSRNLTFDRSWDTALVLDGYLRQRERAFARNNPLGDFFQALPDLCIQTIPVKMRLKIMDLQNEVRKVDFKLPSYFDQENLIFHPLGINNHNKLPFQNRIDRLLIVSPFVDIDFLNSVPCDLGEISLASRLDTLESITPESINSLNKSWYVNPEITINAEDEIEEDLGEEKLHGLHAKLYVSDEGWYSRIWTGSANATNAAYTKNVEFLTELQGRKSQIGIDTFLSGPGSKLLITFEPSGGTNNTDSKKENLERTANDLRRFLYEANIKAVINPAGNLFNVTLKANFENIKAPIGKIDCWPIMLQSTAMKPFDVLSSPCAIFQGLSFQALTSFFAFRVTVEDSGDSFSTEFVLNLTLQGEPEGRLTKVTKLVLENKDKFIKYLLLLLIDYEELPDIIGQIKDLLEPFKDKSARHETQPALLESLLHALSRSPEKLDRVDEIIHELEKTPDGRQLFPEGFDEIWKPIWKARKQLKNG